MKSGVLTYGKLNAISDLIRLPKQQGTLLVLWPTLWSLFMASSGKPEPKTLVIFIIGTFLMRSAGCAINDVADRDFDPHVERTKSRPLANGRLRVKEALLISAALSCLAFLLVLFLNPFTIMLSFAGLFFAAIYPFVKRVSHLPQVALGVAFGWGAIMSWAAVKDSLGAVPLLIFSANILWSTAYDTIYALMDKEDDMRIGVKSTAILFGAHVYKALVLLYTGVAVLLIAAGYMNSMGIYYYCGVVSSLAAFLYIVFALRKEPTRPMAFKGFIANAVIGGALLFFIILDFHKAVLQG